MSIEELSRKPYTMPDSYILKHSEMQDIRRCAREAACSEADVCFNAIALAYSYGFRRGGNHERRRRRKA